MDDEKEKLRKKIPRIVKNVTKTIAEPIKAKGVHANILKNRYTLRSANRTSVLSVVDTSVGQNGRWLLRIDRPHANTNFNHININERLTRLPDPHIPISSATVSVSKSLAYLTNIMQKVNKVAIPVGVAYDSARLGSAIYEDYK